MQLCALDKEGQLIFAARGVKQFDYICLECGQKVRLRSGLHRQPHFYHVQPNNTCRLNGKGMVHLMLQNTLKSYLPEGEGHLEYRFPSIGRIADVVWLPRKLIYEIQCSPITAAEVEARNASYASIGFQVVWIFHDSRYNQNRLSAAEDVLQNWPHYFSDMDDEGHGSIYDHFSLINKGKRIYRLPKMPINPTVIRDVLSEDDLEHVSARWPLRLLLRAQKWSLGFSGDTIERVLHRDEKLADQLKILIEQEQSMCYHRPDFQSQSLWHVFKEGYRRLIVSPYKAVLRLLLERACR